MCCGAKDECGCATELRMNVLRTGAKDECVKGMELRMNLWGQLP